MDCNTCNFPIWSPIENTSFLENNSLVEIKIITFNGTIAGITKDLFRVILVKNGTMLMLDSNLKKRYVWGKEIKITATLTCVCGNQTLFGELISFTITEIYTNNEIIEISFNDTINEDGYAQIEYVVPKIDSFNLEIFYEGNIRFDSSILMKQNIDVRSPLRQLFFDFIPFLILILGVLLGCSLYFVVNKFKRRREE